jgi:beta,beta-carotene 9',10'-dioxygenase
MASVKQASKSENLITAEITEEQTLVPLEVKGAIPNWLTGTLVRNGPIQVSVNGQQVAHWFDGLAMLHAFAFQDGKVVYTNKFIRSGPYHQVFDEGSIHYEGFANDPCRSLFQRFFTFFFPDKENPIKNANVNVAKFADQVVALTETPLPVRFDLKTLKTLGVFDYQDYLPKDRCFESAHPHYDPEKKETINYLIKFGRQTTYNIYRLKEGSSTREIMAEIPVNEPSYMHSFALTQHYVIFTEFPFVVNPLSLMLKGKPFIQNFVWKPEKGTQFLVIDRQSGKVIRKYTTEPFFAFHHVNSYEKEGAIILDIVTYPDASIISDIGAYADLQGKGTEKLAAYSGNRLMRYKLSLATGVITSKVITDKSLELPRVNDTRCGGKEYRYLYAADVRKPTSPNDRRDLSKVNMETREILSWSEEGCYPGEPVFIQKPQSKQEDEGVILSVIFNTVKQRSFLLVLDAKTFQELGRAEVTHVIPEGFHGQYFTNQ